MQPDMAAGLGSNRQQRIMRAVTAAVTALTPCGAGRVAEQPFGSAAGKRTSLGLGARQSARELGRAGALVEECPPVVCGPPTAVGPQQSNDPGLVTPQLDEHSGRGRSRRLQ